MQELIDRGALLTELKTAKEGSMVAVRHIQEHEVYTAESIALTTLSIVEDVINNAPTIDPVKHGRWEQPEEIDVEEGAFRCNICGATFCLIDGTPEENQYFYCPACGARMDADE